MHPAGALEAVKLSKLSLFTCALRQFTKNGSREFFATNHGQRSKALILTLTSERLGLSFPVESERGWPQKNACEAC